MRRDRQTKKERVRCAAIQRKRESLKIDKNNGWKRRGGKTQCEQGREGMLVERRSSEKVTPFVQMRKIGATRKRKLGRGDDHVIRYDSWKKVEMCNSIV